MRPVRSRGHCLESNVWKYLVAFAWMYSKLAKVVPLSSLVDQIQTCFLWLIASSIVSQFFLAIWATRVSSLFSQKSSSHIVTMRPCSILELNPAWRVSSNDYNRLSNSLKLWSTWPKTELLQLFRAIFYFFSLVASLIKPDQMLGSDHTLCIKSKNCSWEDRMFGYLKGEGPYLSFPFSLWISISLWFEVFSIRYSRWAELNLVINGVLTRALSN